MTGGPESAAQAHVVVCTACGARNDVTKLEVGSRASCNGCKEVFTVPERSQTTTKKREAPTIAEMTDEQVKEECKPVLCYYICTPITDPENQNWVFSRKLEMQCFARDSVAKILKENFFLEKVNITYELQTRRGIPVSNVPGEKPIATSWDYRMTRLLFVTFDGKKKLHDISARTGEPQVKSSSSFEAVLKQVLAAHEKYVKDLKKEAAAKAKAAEVKKS